MALFASLNYFLIWAFLQCDWKYKVKHLLIKNNKGTPARSFFLSFCEIQILILPRACNTRFQRERIHCGLYVFHLLSVRQIHFNLDGENAKIVSTFAQHSYIEFHSAHSKHILNEELAIGCKFLWCGNRLSLGRACTKIVVLMLSEQKQKLAESMRKSVTLLAQIWLAISQKWLAVHCKELMDG